MTNQSISMLQILLIILIWWWRIIRYKKYSRQDNKIKKRNLEIIFISNIVILFLVIFILGMRSVSSMQLSLWIITLSSLFSGMFIKSLIRK